MLYFAVIYVLFKYIKKNIGFFFCNYNVTDRFVLLSWIKTLPVVRLIALVRRFDFRICVEIAELNQY